MASSLSLQSSSSSLRVILLLLFLALLIGGIVYLILQRGFFARVDKQSPSVSQPPVIDLRTVASDPRFLRLKDLAPLPELETSAGRDNPFSAYKKATITPPTSKAKIKLK